jgi:signal transduction histidine kinase
MTPEQVDSAIVAVRHAFERIEAFASQALIGEDETTDATAPQWAPLAVGPLLASLSADHTTAARDVGTRVVTNAEAGSPERFVGDPGMVREVLDNLVANAIKYGATGGVVTVTARGEGGHVRFDVHNDGDGIALDDQQRIFDRYWRADDVREGDIPGTGLGLAIVRRLVELHDGVVGVSSRPEEGTTFWVTFPRVAPASPPVSAPSPS